MVCSLEIIIDPRWNWKKRVVAESKRHNYKSVCCFSTTDSDMVGNWCFGGGGDKHPQLNNPSAPCTLSAGRERGGWQVNDEHPPSSPLRYNMTQQILCTYISYFLKSVIFARWSSLSGCSDTFLSPIPGQQLQCPLWHALNKVGGFKKTNILLS